MLYKVYDWEFETKFLLFETARSQHASQTALTLGKAKVELVWKGWI